MCINDISGMINVNILFHADDIKLFTNILSTNNCIRLQHNIDTLSIWYNTSRLPLYVVNCNVLSFTLKTLPKLYLHTFNDLRITFDSRLTLIQEIYLNASITYGLMALSTRDFYINCCFTSLLDPRTTLNIYK